MNGWTDPIDPDAPYRRPAAPADGIGSPRRTEPGGPSWSRSEPADRFRPDWESHSTYREESHSAGREADPAHRAPGRGDYWESDQTRAPEPAGWSSPDTGWSSGNHYDREPERPRRSSYPAESGYPAEPAYPTEPAYSADEAYPAESGSARVTDSAAYPADSYRADPGYSADRGGEPYDTGRGEGRPGWPVESDRTDRVTGRMDWETQPGNRRPDRAEPEYRAESEYRTGDGYDGYEPDAATYPAYGHEAGASSAYDHGTEPTVTAAPSAFWDSPDDPADDRSGPEQRRHRATRRIPRSVALAGSAAVATLVVAVGAGALLVPSGDSKSAPPAAAGTASAAPPGIAEGYAAVPDDAPTSPAATTTAAPRPSTTTTKAAPPADVRKPAPPTPRRTTAKASKPPTGGGVSGQSTGSSQADQVVALVNKQRVANGCGTVQVNAKLTKAAQLHSEDQAAHDTMSHDGSDGSSPWDRAGAQGYSQAIGENVAAGYPTPDAVMDGWMNSPGHRANILNCAAKAIGVGVAAASDGTLYWTQMFGTEV